MEFSITKKEFRNLLLKYWFSNIYFIFVFIPIGIICAKSDGGNMVDIAIFYSIVLILFSLVYPLIIVCSFNKRWKKDVNQIECSLEREENNFRLFNKTIERDVIKFNIDEIKEVKLFKRFGIILVKQNKKKIQVAVETNEYSKKLKEEVEDRQEEKRLNKRKKKKDKGEK